MYNSNSKCDSVRNSNIGNPVPLCGAAEGTHYELTSAHLKSVHEEFQRKEEDRLQERMDANWREHTFAIKFLCNKIDELTKRIEGLEGGTQLAHNNGAAQVPSGAGLTGYGGIYTAGTVLDPTYITALRAEEAREKQREKQRKIDHRNNKIMRQYEATMEAEDA